MKWSKFLIELKPSRIDKGGVGVFAATDIKKGQKIADGLTMEDFQHLVSWEKFDKLDGEIKRMIMAFCVGTPDGFVPPEDKDLNELSVDWYFNHSCGGNLGFDKHGDFVAITDIPKGDEITYDYGLVETNPKFEMRCTCKDKACRKVITGNDWKLLIENLKKKKHIHPFVIKRAKKIGTAE
jgi:hypothetical protein